MSSDGSVTRWLQHLQEGNPAAVQQLWERYFPRMVGLARKKLRDAPQRLADEEDVALSAFHSFCRNAEQGRFPQLLDRDGLWRLLVVITARKAAHLLRAEGRLKRPGGAGAQMPDEDGTGPVLEELLSREPSPAFAAEIAEECQRLLRLLGSRELETVALLKMQGHTNEEIAAQLGYALRSVTRKLNLIRSLWWIELAEQGPVPG
jgi:DNA-directed RNA polymerase specialized sigma24 family protein